MNEKYKYLIIDNDYNEEYILSSLSELGSSDIERYEDSIEEGSDYVPEIYEINIVRIVPFNEVKKKVIESENKKLKERKLNKIKKLKEELEKIQK